MATDIEKILEKREIRMGREDFPLANFYEKTLRAKMLLKFAEQSRSTRIKSESRRQFIIALVTAFEVYVSDLIIELVDKKDGAKESLLDSVTRKYTLKEVDAIIKHRATIGELICREVNLQNLDLTFNLFSEIFGLKFLDLLKKSKFIYKAKSGEQVTVYLRGNFYKRLEGLMTLRHKFIHDLNFKDTPSYKGLLSLFQFIRSLCNCIDVKADNIRGVTTSKIIKK